MTRRSPLPHQVRRAGLGVLDRSHGHAGDRLRLGLVRHEVVDAGERREVDRLARRGVDDAADAALRGEAHRVVDGLERDLELQHDAVGGFEHGVRVVDVGGQQPIVRALDDDDPILAVRLDEDRRHAARRARHDPHLRRVDALRLEVRDRRRPEQVVADARDHRHLGAAQPRRHRLVGALAAPAEVEAARRRSSRRPSGTGRRTSSGRRSRCRPLQSWIVWSCRLYSPSGSAASSAGRTGRRTSADRDPIARSPRATTTPSFGGAAPGPADPASRPRRRWSGRSRRRDRCRC